MGTFGAGVFQNDAAMDARDDVTSHILAGLDDFLNVANFGIEETESIVAYVALLTGLIDTCRASGPSEQEAIGWRDTVLAAFDRDIDELAPFGSYKEERRAVIVATFERFLALCSSDKN